MMGYFGGRSMMDGDNWGVLGIWGVLNLITWILVMLVLIALLRWLWQKGDEKK